MYAGMHANVLQIHLRMC